MRRLALSLIALALLAPAVFARRVRTVHHPAPTCSFSLVPSWGSTPVASGGVTRALVLVYGQSDECSQWAAYSPVDWITVEAAPQAAQPGAFVTVVPNATTQTRNATLVIAGIRLVVTQEGASTVSPPVSSTNLIVNGTFDRDLAGWGWQARYPNSIGTPQWSQFDANGSPASGSMLLRDSDFLFAQGFQQLQCVRITSGRTYAFGGKVRTGSTGGEALIAFLTYNTTDCSGNYSIRYVPSVPRDEPGVWHKYDFTQFVGGSARSAILLFGSAADTPPFDAWFDDAYLQEVK
jgi:hypothetical protein